MEPYRPRPIEYHGVRDWDGWRLKLYSIRYAESPISWTAFEPGLALARAALPRGSGVGFIIAHHGRGMMYVVLSWWDRENELPMRVFVSPDDGSESWRAARGSESVCVWDLEVIWFERQAYVSNLMADRPGDGTASYLAAQWSRRPEGHSR